jgi:TolB-like protein/KaiC/GvpD/RAD55 family RecA-like ATPase/Tfp pilus assembly protein PilF
LFSTGLDSLDRLLGGGYHNKSSILAVGPPGSAKEIAGYSFFWSGLERGDFCVYVTRLPVREVIADMNAWGFPIENTISPSSCWITPEGGQIKYTPNDITNLSICVKQVLSTHRERKIRIIIDVISSLLMLNSPETIYRFLDQLLSEAKQYDMVLVATLEEGMHRTQVLIAMEQLFDGVIELAMTEGDSGPAHKKKREQVLRVRKMMGVALPHNSTIVLSASSINGTPAISTDLRITHGQVKILDKNIRTQEPNAPLDHLRIAILPFANISPDPSDEYFAGGMTEELISTISKISALRVIARTSVMRYKDDPRKAISEIAQELRVGTILEGSVRKSGDKLRITVQLIDSQSSEHLWSESYDREFKDVFAIQSDVSQMVANNLKVKLLPEERKLISKEPTKKENAYELYLRGESARQNAWNEIGIKRAMDYYEKSVEVDSSFAKALARLGDCYALLGNGGWLPPSEAFPRAEEITKKSLALDPNIPEAHHSMSFIKFNCYDWKGAIDEARKALELNPGLLEAHTALAGYLWVIGKLEQAIEEAERAVELDPLSSDAHYVMVQALYFSKNFERCKASLQRMIEVDPQSESTAKSFFGQIYLHDGRYDDAIEEFKQAALPSNGSADYNFLFIAQAYLMSGQKSQAEKVFKDFKEAVGKKDYVPAGNLAWMHAIAGENDEALDCLEKAINERSLIGIQTMKVSPLYDSLRNLPRFETLLRRVGLADSQIAEIVVN